MQVKLIILNDISWNIHTMLCRRYFNWWEATVFLKILTSGNVNIFEVLFRALPKGARSCNWLHIWFILCFSLFLLFLKLDISKKIFRFISLYFMLFNLIVPFFLFLELYIVLFALSRTILCLLTVFVGYTCLHSICSILLSSPTVVKGCSCIHSVCSLMLILSTAVQVIRAGVLMWSWLLFSLRCKIW